MFELDYSQDASMTCLNGDHLQERSERGLDSGKGGGGYRGDNWEQIMKSDKGRRKSGRRQI